MQKIPKLPEELISCILSRLPVKCLIRFKCVCKPWLSLISSHQFAKLQLKQARAAPAPAQAPQNSLKRLFLTSCPLQSIDYEAFVNGGDNTCEKHAYPTRNAPECEVEIIGSCDGLICLVFDYTNLIVWNPSTRASQELPAPDLVDQEESTFFTGFGYDTTIDDYKLIKGVSTTSHDTKDTKFQILRLKNSPWSCIQSIDLSGFTIDGKGTLLDNRLHWLGSKETEKGLNKKYCIISLDLSEELFEEVATLPNHIDENYLPNLGTKEGGGGDSQSLVVFCELGGSHYECWEMKEDRVKSSWTRLFRVSSETFPGYKYGLDLICITKEGKALMEIDQREVIVYTPDEDTCKDFVIQDDWDQFQSVIYEESLVSPSGDDHR